MLKSKGGNGPRPRSPEKVNPNDVFAAPSILFTLPLTVGPGSISMAITLGANEPTTSARTPRDSRCGDCSALVAVSIYLAMDSRTASPPVIGECGHEHYFCGFFLSARFALASSIFWNGASTLIRTPAGPCELMRPKPILPIFAGRTASGVQLQRRAKTITETRKSLGLSGMELYTLLGAGEFLDSCFAVANKKNRVEIKTTNGKAGLTVRVIPVHNEADNPRCPSRRKLRTAASQIKHWDTEILFRDGRQLRRSRGKKCMKFARVGTPVRIRPPQQRISAIKHALSAGTCMCSGDAVIMMDPTCNILRVKFLCMVEAHERGADVVQMVRSDPSV